MKGEKCRLIISMTPSDGAYKACYFDEGDANHRMVPVVCWALVEITLPNTTGEPLREFYRAIHGMVLGESGIVDAETAPGFRCYRKSIFTK